MRLECIVRDARDKKKSEFWIEILIPIISSDNISHQVVLYSYIYLYICTGCALKINKWTCMWLLLLLSIVFSIFHFVADRKMHFSCNRLIYAFTGTVHLHLYLPTHASIHYQRQADIQCQHRFFNFFLKYIYIFFILSFFCVCLR